MVIQYYPNNTPYATPGQWIHASVKGSHLDAITMLNKL